MKEKDLWRRLKDAFKNEPSLELRRVENTSMAGMPDVLFTHHINNFSYHGFIELKTNTSLTALQQQWFDTQPNSWLLRLTTKQNEASILFCNKELLNNDYIVMVPFSRVDLKEFILDRLYCYQKNFNSFSLTF